MWQDDVVEYPRRVRCARRGHSDAGRQALRWPRPGSGGSVSGARAVPVADGVENVEIGLVARVSHPRSACAGSRHADMTGLSGRENQIPAVLSCGQKQRGFGRSGIGPSPPVLLLTYRSPLWTPSRVYRCCYCWCLYMRVSAGDHLVTHDVVEGAAGVEVCVMVPGRASGFLRVVVPRTGELRSGNYCGS